MDVDTDFHPDTTKVFQQMVQEPLDLYRQNKQFRWHLKVKWTRGHRWHMRLWNTKGEILPSWFKESWFFGRDTPKVSTGRTVKSAMVVISNFCSLETTLKRTERQRRESLVTARTTPDYREVSTVNSQKEKALRTYGQICCGIKCWLAIARQEV